MQLIVLVDDNKGCCNLDNEHGLSYYIEVAGYKLLFDCGPSDIFLKNVEKLGIDIRGVDYLILSHGHYDHSGGLRYFLDTNKNGKILCKKEAFLEKFSKSTGFFRPVGIDIDYIDWQDRFLWVEEYLELDKDIKIIGKITSKKEVNENFAVKVNGNLVVDEFEDELFLVLEASKIVSGCSHRGVIDIIKEGNKHNKITTFIGGMHTKKLPKVEVEAIAEDIKNLGVKKIITGHCTGREAYETIKDINGDVEYSSLGRGFKL